MCNTGKHCMKFENSMFRKEFICIILVMLLGWFLLIQVVDITRQIAGLPDGA